MQPCKQVFAILIEKNSKCAEGRRLGCDCVLDEESRGLVAGLREEDAYDKDSRNQLAVLSQLLMSCSSRSSLRASVCQRVDSLE